MLTGPLREMLPKATAAFVQIGDGAMRRQPAFWVCTLAGVGDMTCEVLFLLYTEALPDANHVFSAMLSFVFL